jgi:hypothetical protein
MKKIILFLITVQCSVFSVYWANAQVINVPGDQPTIQAGINAASDGDTVLVADGTYLENINFRGKAITVASHYLTDPDTNHIYNTVIDGSSPLHADSAAVVMFLSGEDTSSIIYGFTLRGGSGLKSSTLNGKVGGGVSCDESGAKIMHNRIINNELMDNAFSLGGGIYIISKDTEPWVVIGHNYIADNIVGGNTLVAGGGMCLSSSARVFSNTITSNQANCTGINHKAEGGGVACESLGELDVISFHDNEITNNSCSSEYVYGVGICIYNSQTTIKNNNISHNNATGIRTYGSGIRFMYIYGDVLIENNTFHENSHNSDTVAMGVVNLRGFLNADADVRLINNSFTDNYVSDGTYSGYIPATTVANSMDTRVIVDGNFVSGHEGERAGGIYLYNAYNVHVTNNVFSDNYVSWIGGVIYVAQNVGNVSDQRSLIANNTFLNNYADGYGGVFYFSSSYDSYCPVIMNNIFWGNDCGSTWGEDIYYQGSEDLWLESNDIDTDQIYGNWDGHGNYTCDPAFIDDSCHIPQNGGCVDKGTDSLFYKGYWYMAPLVDFEGHPRPDTICGLVDVGADERLDCLGVGVDELRVAGCGLRVSPNPTKGITTLRYLIRDSGYLISDLYTIGGRKIRELVRQHVNAGTYEIQYDFHDLPDGVYLVRMTVGKENAVRKVIVQ